MEMMNLQSKHQEVQNSVMKLQNDIKTYQSRLAENQAFVDKVRQSEIKLKEEVGKMKFENANLNSAINSYKDSLKEVDGLDLQIHLVKSNNGTYGISGDKRRRKKSEGKLASVISSIEPSSTKSFFKNSPSKSIVDITTHFTNAVNGVHSLSQSIGQAKMMDKFLK